MHKFLHELLALVYNTEVYIRGFLVYFSREISLVLAGTKDVSCKFSPMYDNNVLFSLPTGSDQPRHAFMFDRAAHQVP